jgi:hypothetical protein
MSDVDWDQPLRNPHDDGPIGVEDGSDLRRLLEALGRDPDERISINHYDRAGNLVPEITTVAGAQTAAAKYVKEDCYFGAQPTRAVPRGRGLASDVIGLRDLYADLDVKPGGMKTWDAARNVINTLSDLLGVAPVGIVNSGGGLQPHWAVERGDDTDWADEKDPRHGNAQALLRRWGRLVAHTAAGWQGSVDSVYDLSRILRVPGTTNCKGEHVTTTLELCDGAPVSTSKLDEVCEAEGVVEIPSDRRQLGEVQSAHGTWEWAEETCAYADHMIAGWSEDVIEGGRHPWLIGQAIRLAAAHRYGCLAEEGHKQGAEAIAKAFRSALQTGPSRAPKPATEIDDCIRDGVPLAERFTDEKVAEEVGGGHQHAEPVAPFLRLVGEVGSKDWAFCVGEQAGEVVTLAGKVAEKAGQNEAKVGPWTGHAAPYTPIDWHELFAATPVETEWLCEPIIARGENVAIYSPAKAGKSLLTLEIVAALAAGRPVLGNPARPPLRILYVDMENSRRDLFKRLRALGYGPDDLSNLTYLSFAALPTLDSAPGGRDLLAVVEACRAELVVIDTVSRVIAGKENDADTFHAVYRCSLIPLKQRGISVLRLDHSGKDAEKGQRGSSGKNTDVDAIWQLIKKSETRLYLKRDDGRSAEHAGAVVELTREDAPLRHTVTTSATSMARDIQAAVEAMDRLDVPTEWSRRAVRKAVELSVSNAALGEAITARRDRLGPFPSLDPLTAVLHAHKSGPGTAGTTHVIPGVSDGPRTAGTTPDHPEPTGEHAGHSLGSGPRTTGTTSGPPPGVPAEEWSQDSATRRGADSGPRPSTGPAANTEELGRCSRCGGPHPSRYGPAATGTLCADCQKAEVVCAGYRCTESVDPTDGQDLCAVCTWAA